MKEEKEVTNNERGLQVYRKLLYFSENKIPVHFSTIGHGWKNGEILDLNGDKLTLVLKEFVEGEMPFLCEEIVLESIVVYKGRERDG